MRRERWEEKRSGYPGRGCGLSDIKDETYHLPIYQARLSSIPLILATHKRERGESLRKNENERIAELKEKEEKFKEEQSKHALSKSQIKTNQISKGQRWQTNDTQRIIASYLSSYNMLYSESVINTVQNIQLPNAILIDNWKVRINGSQLSYINRHESLRRI